MLSILRAGILAMALLTRPLSLAVSGLSVTLMDTPTLRTLLLTSLSPLGDMLVAIVVDGVRELARFSRGGVRSEER